LGLGFKMNKKQIIIIIILIMLASLIYLSVNAYLIIKSTQTSGDFREIPIGTFDDDAEPPKTTPTPVKENYEIEKI